MRFSAEGATTISLGVFPPGLNVSLPTEGHGPLEYAEALGEAYLSFSRHHHRKSGGHYLTPPDIARFMAGHSSYSEPHMRILDPGSGTGILSAAVREKLAEVGVPITEHDKLPDVVLYDEERNWLFLVEAVTSHGPVNPKRVEELEVTLKGCTATRVYVSAFPDFRQFKQYVDKIAWEIEVWLAEIPDHLIHFNGDKFLGPREVT